MAEPRHQRSSSMIDLSDGASLADILRNPPPEVVRRPSGGARSRRNGTNHRARSTPRRTYEDDSIRSFFEAKSPTVEREFNPEDFAVVDEESPSPLSASMRSPSLASRGSSRSRLSQTLRQSHQDLRESLRIGQFCYTELKSKERQILELKTSQSQLESEVSDLTEDVQRSQRNLADLEFERSRLQRDVEKYREERTNALVDSHEKSQMLAELNGKVETYGAKMRRLKLKCSSLSADLDAEKKSTRRLRDEKAGLQTQIVQSERRLEDIKRRSEDVNAETDAVREELQTVRERAKKNLEVAEARARKQLTTLKVSFRDLMKEKVGLEKQLEKTQLEVVDVKKIYGDRIRSLEMGNSELRAQFRTAEEEQERMKTEFEETIKARLAALDATASKERDLIVAAHHQELKDQESALRNAHRDVEQRLQKELDGAVSQHEQTMSEMKNAFDSAMSEHEKSMSELKEAHASDLETGKRRSDGLLQKLHSEHQQSLAELKISHSEELNAEVQARERLSSEFRSEKAKMAEMMEKQTQSHDHEYSELEKQHAEKIASLQKKLEDDLGSQQIQFDNAIRDLRASHVADRSRLDNEHSAALAAKQTELEEIFLAEKEKLQAQIAGHVREGLEKEKEIAMLRETHAGEILADTRKFDSALESLSEELKSEKDKFNDLRSEHLRGLEELESFRTRNSEISESFQQRTSELESATTRVSQLESDLTSAEVRRGNEIRELLEKHTAELKLRDDSFAELEQKQSATLSSHRIDLVALQESFSQKFVEEKANHAAELASVRKEADLAHLEQLSDCRKSADEVQQALNEKLRGLEDLLAASDDEKKRLSEALAEAAETEDKSMMLRQSFDEYRASQESQMGLLRRSLLDRDAGLKRREDDMTAMKQTFELEIARLRSRLELNLSPSEEPRIDESKTVSGSAVTSPLAVVQSTDISDISLDEMRDRFQEELKKNAALVDTCEGLRSEIDALKARLATMESESAYKDRKIEYYETELDLKAQPTDPLLADSDDDVAEVEQRDCSCSLM